MTAAATTYRPVRFAEVVGQDHVKPVLRAMVIHDDPPPAMLFTGSRGTGKTTTARILAAALNCSDATAGDACGSCPSCKDVQFGSSVSALEIDAASHGLVDDIRSLRDAVSVSHMGSWRVVLLDEAHSMSEAAFNALLKTLEEPPPRTCFVLLTTEPNKIMPTVRSRSMLFEFRRLTEVQIAEHLEMIDTTDEGLEGQRPVVSSEVFTEIAQRAEGGMRDAVMMYDQARRAGVYTLDRLREMFGWEDHSAALYDAALNTDHATLHTVADAVFRQSGDALALVHDLVLYTRDLLVLRSGGSVAIPEESKDRLAAAVPTAHLVRVMRVLWEAEQRLSSNLTSQRASLALVTTMFANAVASVPEPEATARSRDASVPMQDGQTETRPAPKRLTLTEMVTMAQEARTP